MDKKRKKPLWIILILSIIVVILAFALFYRFFLKDKINKIDHTENTETSISTTVESSKVNTENTEKEVETTKKFKKFKLAEEPYTDAVDFDELQKINEDLYAWIYVPNTNVDYPVAQSTKVGDDSFYLEHNIYKEYQFSGTIYSEIKNRLDFNDPVTVLYGHNMINGTMFQSLHNFEDKDFFDKNNTMFVFTKDKLITYLIYSCFDYDDRHILNTRHMERTDDFMSFVDDTLDPRSLVCNIRDDVKINKDDKLLVLSTCSNHSSTSRYLTVGVKVRERYRK